MNVRNCLTEAKFYLTLFPSYDGTLIEIKFLLSTGGHKCINSYGWTTEPTTVNVFQVPGETYLSLLFVPFTDNRLDTVDNAADNSLYTYSEYRLTLGSKMLNASRIIMRSYNQQQTTW